jgi:hypothetical protein
MILRSDLKFLFFVNKIQVVDHAIGGSNHMDRKLQTLLIGADMLEAPLQLERIVFNNPGRLVSTIIMIISISSD